MAQPQRPVSSPPATDADCTLVIHASGFRNQTGDAGGAIYNSPVGWPSNLAKAYKHGPYPITGDHAVLTFEHIPPGRYGVVVIHDENSNHKLDRNFFGFPKEGFGFANNPHVGLSAPNWTAATVKVSCPVTETDIRIMYK
ncbi:MAG: DUF2141 domain-containing protein [Acidobacteriaceae bacterium]